MPKLPPGLLAPFPLGPDGRVEGLPHLVNHVRQVVEVLDAVDTASALTRLLQAC